MTDPEIVSWMKLLGKTKVEQHEMIMDLIQHANEDGMSEEDMKDCLRGIELLDNVT